MLFLALGMHSALITATAAEFNPVIIAGVETGGKTLATITDIFTGEVNTIKAGEGLRLGVGGSMSFGDNNQFSLETTINYKFENQDIIGGTIGFSVIPIDAIAYYGLNDKLRIATGATFHLNPSLSCDCNINTDFDSSFGFIMAADYQFSGVITGLRYTSMDYSGVSASNIGVYVTKLF